MKSESRTRINIDQMSNRNQISSETQAVSSKWSLLQHEFSSQTRPLLRNKTTLLRNTTAPPKQERSSETLLRCTVQGRHMGRLMDRVEVVFVWKGYRIRIQNVYRKLGLHLRNRWIWSRCHLISKLWSQRTWPCWFEKQDRITHALTDRCGHPDYLL